MGMSKISIILFATSILVTSMGCQKVTPEIFLLGGSKDSTSPNSANDPKAGRVTLGSANVTSGGGYQLKGRVSFVSQGATVSSGGYTLTGTVKF
jgi:hypothetical protein